MNPIDAMSKAVTEGKTSSQFAVPDGEHYGDFFFITDKYNRIIIALCWTGHEWIHEHQVFNVFLPEGADTKTFIRMGIT